LHFDVAKIGGILLSCPRLGTTGITLAEEERGE
jgi:hypothetical protein